MSCASCSAPASLVCSGCKSVRYCGADHQRSHWSSHKTVCKAVKQLNESKKGFLKVIVKEGTGDAPRAGQQVKCHYTGTLVDGTTFDSSRTRDEPFEFPVGKGQVIRAWDEGIATMKAGERAILYCSPEYAYGSRGAGGAIPPNSTLVFDVEVLSIGGGK